MNGVVIYRAGKSMRGTGLRKNREFIFYYSHFEIPFGYPGGEIITRQLNI